MHLIPNWRDVLARAWSIRLMMLAGLLSGLEAILPFLAPSFPPGVFAIFSMLLIAGAFVARLVAQRDLRSDQP